MAVDAGQLKLLAESQTHLPDDSAHQLCFRASEHKYHDMHFCPCDDVINFFEAFWMR